MPLSDKLAFLRHNLAVLVPLYLGFAFCFMAAYGSAAWAPTMLMRSIRAQTRHARNVAGAVYHRFLDRRAIDGAE